MTIKEKLKSLKSSEEYPEARIINYQNIDFTVFPIDYISIYSTKKDFEDNKFLIRVPIYELNNINQSLLDYKFDYFTLKRTKLMFTEIDLVFIINYEYKDNSTVNMKVKVIE